MIQIRKIYANGILAATLAAAAPAHAQSVPSAPVVFFDFFFSDNAGIPQDNFNQFVQWNVTGGSVDLVGGVGPGVFGAPPNDPRGRFVDLGGSTGNPGLFSTKLPLDLLAGATYNLSFMYRSTAPGQQNSADVSFGGQTFTVATASEAFNEFSQSFVVGSMASSPISFQGLESDTDNAGVGIDGVVLRITQLADGSTPATPGLTLPAAVPEPATWGMMLLGFGAVGASLRRRSTRALAPAYR